MLNMYNYLYLFLATDRLKVNIKLYIFPASNQIGKKQNPRVTVKTLKGRRAFGLRLFHWIGKSG